MKETTKISYKSPEKLVKMCHVCTKVSESDKELERCPHCQKSFLPLNYFDKVHFSPKSQLKELFTYCEEIEEEFMIKGIHVKW